MPVLTRIRSLFRKETTPIINDGRGNLPTVTIRGGFGYLPGARWTDREYPFLAKSGYQSNSDVYACVSLIATTAKQVKFDLAVGRDLLVLLRAAGGRSFIESWISYILLSGNCFIEIGRNAAGAPVALYLVQPDRVTAKTNINTPGAEDNRRPQVNMWIVRNAKGMQYPVLPQDMVHSRLFHPLDEIFGMAPLEAAMLQVDAQNEGATLMKRMLQGGFAPGWIEAAEDSEWSDTQVAQLRERLRRSRESGEALWLQNAKWHEMGFPPVDSGVAEHQVLSKRDIASVFHVPPQLIGDTQSQTYSNYHSARQALYMEAVWPLLTQFRDDLNRTVGRDLKSEMEFDKDSFDAIAAARTEAADRVHKLWTAGLITQNEGRRDLEYDTVQGGDVFYAPANFLPLGGEVAPEAPES